MNEIFCICDYHWIWYLIGFLFAPKIVIAVFVCQYLPVSIVCKIGISLLAFLSHIKVNK